MYDMYKKLELPAGPVSKCPVCGSDAELWQYAKDETSPRSLAVMCSHGEALGPQDGLVNQGCLLFMAPHDFYQPTIREAVRFWNAYSDALVALRVERAFT